MRFSLPVALPILISCLASSGCAADTLTRGERLAQDMLIVDTHIDVPYRLEQKPADISQATPDGDFDYPRAEKGGLDVAFMSIYVPAHLSQERATPLADKLISGIERIVTQSPDKFAIATSTADVAEQEKAGLMSFALGMENGEPIAGKLDNLQHFYDRGIRYITLAHSKSNHISDSSYDPERRWEGLSPFGQRLVLEMNKLGIMVDVSHITDDAFWHVMQVSKVPVIASHSSARHFTPGFERNMSDEMITALAENGGVIQINFGSSFITQEAREWYDNLNAAREVYRKATDTPDGDPKMSAFTAGYMAAYPFPFADLEDVLDHIDHVVELVGVDHVGIGSDYDGVGNTLPTGLKSAADYPNLVEGLLARGYSESDIEKILGGNLMRVWREVETYAEQH